MTIRTEQHQFGDYTATLLIEVVDKIQDGRKLRVYQATGVYWDREPPQDAVLGIWQQWPTHWPVMFAPVRYAGFQTRPKTKWQREGF